jgi:predicted Mrr-cat superfamily restriction endonuclease
MQGNVIAKFDNSKEASVTTGVCQRNILQVASKETFNKKGGIRKQAGGYIWKFAE